MSAAVDSLADDVEAIEQAFISQWAHFGQGPGGQFHSDGDLIWTEAPVTELPYNAVVRTRLGADADGRIDEVIDHFRRRGVQFMWPVLPTTEPADLARGLVQRGLAFVEHGTGMSLDPAHWKIEPRATDGPIDYVEVDNNNMWAYEELIAQYWELRDESREYVFGVNSWAHGLGHGRRLVAFQDGQPVGKAYLSYTLGEDSQSVSTDTASIFGVYVKPEARGYRVATTLMELLIDAAFESGRKRVVLHSSQMALALYLRMGFAARCSLPVYATTPLHSLQPS
ncbi:MAG: GNAT family N-acetyltransferase [Actinobacteria bacterium]|nr:GNAT family N-acetyltransferase [Actinomycetota bacterium]